MADAKLVVLISCPTIMINLNIKHHNIYVIQGKQYKYVKFCIILVNLSS
jgi:hypothetical protein